MRAAALLAFAALALSACGFTPMYARPGLTPGLAAVETIAPEGRIGFLLRQSLDDELGRDKALPPAYRLEMTLVETRTPRGLRIDNVAGRYELVIVADWKLIELSTRANAAAGRTQAMVTYDTAEQPYAGIVAEQDGEARVAAEAARKIRLDLASWLASRE